MGLANRFAVLNTRTRLDAPSPLPVMRSTTPSPFASHNLEEKPAGPVHVLVSLDNAPLFRLVASDQFKNLGLGRFEVDAGQFHFESDDVAASSTFRVAAPDPRIGIYSEVFTLPPMDRTRTTWHEYRRRHLNSAAIPELAQSGQLGWLLNRHGHRTAKLVWRHAVWR